MLQILSSKLTFGINEHLWAGVFCENGFFVIVEIDTQEEKASATVKGKEILNIILTSFSNLTERNQASVSKIIAEVRERKDIKTLVIGLSEGDNLYLATHLNGTIYMKREGIIGNILRPNEKATGKLKNGDTLIVASDSLIDALPDDTFQSLFLAPINDIPSIAYPITQNPTIMGKALLVIKFLQENPETTTSHSHDEFFPKSKNRIIESLTRWKRLFQKDTLSSHETPEESRAKKTLLTVSLFLILLLLISVFFNVSNKRNASVKERMSETLNIITHQYDEAINLIDLNPIRSRTLLSDSKLSLSALLSELPKDSREFKEINEWLAKISEAEVRAYKIYKLTAVPLFFDINLIKQGGQGDIITSYRETTAVLDKKNKVVYTLTTDTKQASIIAGETTVKNANSLGIHGKAIYLVNSDGIVKLDTTSKSNKVVIPPDAKWGEISSISAFGGNIYLLDTKNNTIWKYIATESGFSAITPYLNADVSVNLAGARKMVIDGSVWVSLDNQLLKFNRGIGDSFEFLGFSDTIATIGSLFASDSDTYLYLLDTQLSRVLVFDKDGVYQSQYQWDDLKGATDIVVNESEKKIFALIGSKIYGIDIK